MINYDRLPGTAIHHDPPPYFPSHRSSIIIIIIIVILLKFIQSIWPFGAKIGPAKCGVGGEKKKAVRSSAAQDYAARLPDRSPVSSADLNLIV